MNEWSSFFGAVVGAAATLTGLIFVGVSISLTKILSLPGVPTRASQSLILLLTVLIVSALCLVPRQSLQLMGAEFLCIGITVWAVTLKLNLAMLRRAEIGFKKHALANIVFTQLAVLPYLVAGVITLVSGIYGIFWLIPAIIFSFIKAVVDAWVLLVEIHR